MWVVTLDQLEGTESPELVGGKAGGLYRLLRAGFRVPEGYVVTTRAFRQTLRQPLFGLKTPDEMRQAVLSSPIPVEIERAIRDVHEQLFGRQPVAVRSSAVAEDTGRQSFAGQFESVLGVEGEEDVLKAIRSVWASFFTTKHLLYRARLNLDEPPSLVAVVVQKMLAPRIAGVMFTADPVGGHPDRIVLSAVSGLGEAVVDGHSAETAYVDLPSGRVVQHVPADAQGQRVLRDEDIELLVAAATRVNREFGEPQDLEWALDERGLALLQCRPITAGKHGAHPGGASVWSNVNVGEALPGVATPMTWSIIWSFARRGFEQAFGALGLEVPHDRDLVSSFVGRVYLNLTEFASIASQVPFLSVTNLLAVGGGSNVDMLDQMGFERRSPVSFITRLPLTLSRMAVSQLSTPRRARSWAARLRQKREEFFRADLRPLGSSELLKVLADVDHYFEYTGTVMLACGSNFLSSYIVTRGLLRRWGGQEAAQKEQHLFSGLRGLASAEPGLELLDMARFVSEHPGLVDIFANKADELVLDALQQSSDGRILLDRLREFLRNYGLRAAREAELSTPRWHERPEFLVGVIKRHLEAPFLPKSEDLKMEREASRRETTHMIRQYFRTGLGLLFRGILVWTQENARLREDLRACVIDTLAMYRHLFLEIGQRLTRSRIVAEPDDVFFLTRHEIVRYLECESGAMDLSLTVAMRRAGYVAFKEAPDPPDSFVLDLDGGIKQTRQRLPLDTPFIQGLAASPGRITGRARVMTDISAPTDIHPGEVLVASLTDVGWTPLFLIASGVVTDMGGPLSHASIVAREYGIPAVVSAKDSTLLIKTGDLVTVDGNSGRVYLQR